MGPEDGLKAVQLLRPRITIPMHYNTWDLIAQDVDAFRETVANKTISKCLVMMPGSTQDTSFICIPDSCASNYSGCFFEMGHGEKANVICKSAFDYLRSNVPGSKPWIITP